jgi:hypothetical protein
LVLVATIWSYGNALALFTNYSLIYPYLINYYNDRLYIGDYTVGSTRYKNSVMMSSPPLGILGLVDGDHAAADCGADDWITVTDTKYIYTNLAIVGIGAYTALQTKTIV